MNIQDYVNQFEGYFAGMSREQLETYVQGASGERGAGETDEALAIRQALVEKANETLARSEAIAGAFQRLDGLVKTNCDVSQSSPSCIYAKSARHYLGKFMKSWDTVDLANGLDSLSKSTGLTVGAVAELVRTALETAQEVNDTKRNLQETSDKRVGWDRP